MKKIDIEFKDIKPAPYLKNSYNFFTDRCDNVNLI